MSLISTATGCLIGGISTAVHDGLLLIFGHPGWTDADFDLALHHHGVHDIDAHWSYSLTNGANGTSIDTWTVALP